MDPATEAELNRGPVHRCLRRHLTGGRSGSGLSSHLGTSPDSKSTVWGWIRDISAGPEDMRGDESIRSGRIQEEGEHPVVVMAASATGNRNEPEGAKAAMAAARSDFFATAATKSDFSASANFSSSDVNFTKRSQRSDTDLTNTKLQRKSSNKRRPPRPLASMSADCVGIVGNTPLVPSPSHLSVEKCYELLAATPIGAPPAQQKAAPGILPPKLAPIPSGANAAEG